MAPIDIVGRAPALVTSGLKPARGFFASAHYFFLGVKALSGAPSDVAPARALLAAQSTECALKAFLSAKGLSVATLKNRPFGHDLERLWKEAWARGNLVSQDPPIWCVILNQTHCSPFHLRYPLDINGFQTPEPISMEAELGSLLNRLEAIL